MISSVVNKTDILKKELEVFAKVDSGLLWTFDQFNDWCEKVFENVEGDDCSYEDSLFVDNSGGNSAYGELLPFSMHIACQLFNINTHDVFLDLGSGVGKLVFQTAFQYGIKSYGLELSNHCHQHATQILQTTQQKTVATDKNIQTEFLSDSTYSLLDRIFFYQWDILSTHYPLDTTFILFNGLLFDSLAKIKVTHNIEELISQHPQLIYKVWSVGSQPLPWTHSEYIIYCHKEKYSGTWTLDNLRYNMLLMNDDADSTNSQQITYMYWLTSKYTKLNPTMSDIEKQNQRTVMIGQIKKHLNHKLEMLRPERKAMQLKLLRSMIATDY